MTVRKGIAITSATLAILGGMTGVALAQSESGIGRVTRDTGIMVALGGLLTALGTQVQPILKLYLDNQRLQFDVQTAVNAAAADRQMIIDRVIYNESRINHLYQTLLPDHPPPKPPDFPSGASASVIKKISG
jgi:hypothetical protein